MSSRSPQQRLLDTLDSHGQTIAVAEAPTGGELSSAMTHLPDANDVFRGGIVAPTDKTRRELLGVDASTLDRHGVASETTATEMATEVRERTDADWGVATAGYAGDAPTEDDRGVLYVAIVHHGVGGTRGSAVKRYRFQGLRRDLTEQMTERALRAALARVETVVEH